MCVHARMHNKAGNKGVMRLQTPNKQNTIGTDLTKQHLSLYVADVVECAGVVLPATAASW